jgi:RNA polymerase sigma factor (sigma-70 family)
MVLGVCRRVTADHQLAEDAFQAAFLVLARRAADIRPREAVRGWIYGVASRTAQKARVMSVRRRAREMTNTTIPDNPAAMKSEPDSDALRILDEELARLHDHLRVAVVLCELDGLTRKDAAVRLGIPEGTLSSRLAKARQLLAEQLRKRGVTLSIAALSVTLGQLASAAVPLRLAHATAGLVDGSVPVSQAVETLSQGALRIMFLTKLKLAILSTLLIVTACFAVRGTLSDASAQEPTKQRVVLALHKADDKQPRPVAKPGAGTLLLAHENKLVTLAPDDKDGKETPLKGAGASVQCRLAPDGTQAVFLVVTGKPRKPEDIEDPWAFQLVVQKLGQDKSAFTADYSSHDSPIACWSHDGKKIVVSTVRAREPDVEFENVLLDLSTGKSEGLTLPAHTRVLDWSRDGKIFLVQEVDLKAKKSRLGLAAAGDKEVTVLCDLRDHPWWRASGRLSPDGKRVLFLDADPEDKDARKWGVSSKPYLLDVATKKRELLGEFPENARAMGAAWSPDGKKVAFTWTQLHPDVLKKDTLTVEDLSKETESFLIVADADGKNAKTLVSEKSSRGKPVLLGIDWR